MEAPGTTESPGAPAGISASASALASPGPPRSPTRAWTSPTWSRTTGRGAAGSWRSERGLPSPCAGTRRRVPRVTDGEVALERPERGVVEDLGDESHVLVDEDLSPVADGDAGRLLAA